MTWKELFAEESRKPYMRNLQDVLAQDRVTHRVYPTNSMVFSVFQCLSFDNTRVVMLGQNPYHGPGQAHGLAFSVQKGVPIPPSLQNIYKELHDDVDFKVPLHGNLSEWVDQGVLLLNSSLTVIEGNATSHMNIGWEEFTNRVISELSKHRSNLIFVLWGAYAQSKARLIDAKKHHILKCAHPSPLSAHRGFFGCRHFSKINKILTENNEEPINWQIT